MRFFTWIRKILRRIELSDNVEIGQTIGQDAENRMFCQILRICAILNVSIFERKYQPKIRYQNCSTEEYLDQK